jgi:hypothetical protein
MDWSWTGVSYPTDPPCTMPRIFEVSYSVYVHLRIPDEIASYLLPPDKGHHYSKDYDIDKIICGMWIIHRNTLHYVDRDLVWREIELNEPYGDYKRPEEVRDFIDEYNEYD